MTEVDRQIRNIDPDYFDLLVTALSGLSSIAQLATSWSEYRKVGKRNRNEAQQVHIRESLRQVQQTLDDLFHNTREAVRQLERAHISGTGGTAIDHKAAGFGIRLPLNQQEMQALMQPLNSVSSAINTLKVQIVSLEMVLAAFGVDGEENINFDMALFNDDLNVALFDSRDIGEMRDRIFILERRADDFLRSARRVLAPN
ncbi:hypothetical protein [Tardiphaga sp. 841_E9_N1_2]|jgi:hypothetical protein|uniref:hypothetical protein n=1 Tax=Tardiphaga sp. 841_E9_N1_2 TaxID=3240762 RepID=UPI003F24FC0A